MKLTKNPKILFLIDGIGALVSALMLAIVLVEFEAYIGIPRGSLYILAIFPLAFSLFDLYSYNTSSINTVFKLRVISFCNIFYCFMSLGFVQYHSNSISGLGVTYVLIEIIIVLSIAVIEYDTSSQIKKLDYGHKD